MILRPPGEPHHNATPEAAETAQAEGCVSPAVSELMHAVAWLTSTSTTDYAETPETPLVAPCTHPAGPAEPG